MSTRRIAAGLPAYTGPDGSCPRCGLPGAMTEWHWAAPHAPGEMAGRLPPCAGHDELAVLDGAGEHLCRVCLNCGYGWPEACLRRDGTPSREPPPPGWAGLLSLASSLASAAAGSLLSQVFHGPALAVMWLTVTTVIAVIAVLGYAVLTEPGADAAETDQTGKEPNS